MITPEPSSAKDPNLILSAAALGELKVHTLACQSLVDLGVGVESVIDTAPFLLIQHDLEDLGAVFLGADALADDFDGEDEIGEDGIVHGCERTRAWALLLLRCTAAVGALGTGKNAAGSDDEDMAVRELLLEFAGEASMDVSCKPHIITIRSRKGK
jgi:hypothetical protein